MYILSLLWIYFMPILVSCGLFGGIFLIITGVIYRKLLVIVMGLLSLCFVVLPFVFWGMGIDWDKFFPIPTILYWILFSLTGLLAGFNGLQAKIKSIRNMGFIIFTTGVFGTIFYYLMSVSHDSFYIN
ncbi:ammonia permease [Bacillus cereus]|uniref:ammonia permease n=1 Tax=Bacillus cereus group TaxID=86661 RepID=UPI000BECEA9C|nr:ammonia permease [Bacillus toyonensis]PEE14280.1 ammonia permease [Bacillus cereus]MCG3797361.1 ammonia permease [Bacillus toyonensis]PEL72464.1 ammonia permease [Bacillus toyonensis]PFF27115.1 ammonia permease [Bacillus cereus]PFH82272.1 ammonia permease [Bacillus cereus]